MLQSISIYFNIFQSSEERFSNGLVFDRKMVCRLCLRLSLCITLPQAELLATFQQFRKVHSSTGRIFV